MKKQYEKPELKTEAFDVEDVITVSVKRTFTDSFQTVMDRLDNLFSNLDYEENP